MKIKFRFSPRMNWWFYTAFGALFISGVVWLAVHYLTGEGQDFDGKYNLFQSRLMKIHGASAMVSLIVLGALIPTHMQRAWQQKRNRLTALILVSLCALMIISGYGLYYCGSDEIRLWLSSFHSISGVSLPLALVWHIVSGKQQRARKYSA